MGDKATSQGWTGNDDRMHENGRSLRRLVFRFHLSLFTQPSLKLFFSSASKSFLQVSICEHKGRAYNGEDSTKLD